jgi:WD40 repeat protein
VGRVCTLLDAELNGFAKPSQTPGGREQNRAMTAAVSTRPPDLSSRPDAYDCFLSHARDPDQALAEAVQKGLAGLAKPWYRRRALRVFLDTASLSASAELEASIVEGLERSRFFVLLASPAAAGRPWVDREVTWWREHREPHTFLIADYGAHLRWDERLGDFAADAQIPPSLRGWFPTEPTWTDLTWAHGDTDLRLRNPRFSSHIADLAAPLRAMSKDELVGEDIRQHHRSLRLAWSAAGALLLLAVAATIAAVLAITQRHQALVQRDRAQSRALAALAEATRSSDPLTSLRDATQSLGIDSTPEATRALRGTLAVPLRRVLHANERVDGLEFSPDGTRLAQRARSGVKLWSLKTGRVAPASARGPSFVVDFAFDASGRRLVSVGQIGTINALQVTDLSRQSAARIVRFGNLMRGAMSPDGGTVALATQAGSLALRDLRSGRTIVLDRHGAGSMGMQFSPDGGQLVAIGGHGLSIWPTAQAGGRVDIRSGPLLAARITSKGTVVGVGGDGAVTTWSLDGTPRTRTRIVTGPEPALAISHDGRLVGVGSGSTVAVWDLLTGGQRVLGSHPGGAITALAFGPGNRSLASVAEGDTLIRIWDLQTAPPAPAAGSNFYASIITVSTDGALIAATEDLDSAVAVWPRDGSSRRVFHGGPEGILAAGFMPASHQVLTVSDDGAARVVDATTGARRVVRGKLGPADVAALSPDRRRVAVAIDGGPLRVWNLAGGPPVTLARRTHGLTDLGFSADGHIAGANGARYVDVWSVRGGAPARLTAPERVNLVAFGRSSDALAAGGGEAGAGVFLWHNVDSHARPVLLGRHRHFVTAIAFSPDQSGVASAGDTGPVYLWPLDGSSGITLADGTAQATDALAFDRSGGTLAMSDGTLRLLHCEACGPQARLIRQAQRLQRGGGLP